MNCSSRSPARLSVIMTDVARLRMVKHGASHMDTTGLLLRAELAIGECKRSKRPLAWYQSENDSLRAHHLSLLSSPAAGSHNR